MQLKINDVVYKPEKDMKLLQYLRDELHLTGTKNGCSEGACGACTVIVNGKKTKACVPMLSKLEDAEVITIEGLSDLEKEIYSYCFAEAGAVQCGFCIPGMIMSAKALIDENNNPTREDVKKAIRGNICRCTGYVKIEDAILMAARYFREGISVVPEKESGRLSTRFRRVDAVEKALGEGKYSDDYSIDGMVYASALRSPAPRCRIIKIDSSKCEEDPRCVAVIKREQVPENKLGHLKQDWDVLIGEGMITHYMGDALCLVVSDDKNALEDLKKLIVVEYEELEGVFTPEDALTGKILVHENEKDNILTTQHILRGDAISALKKCEYVVEQDYHTPFTEHAFMEPECALALPDKNNGIFAITGSQSIYDDQREIAHMLHLPKHRVRVHSALVGGGFGGKEDMSVQHHAALCAYILQRPVKVKLSRQESLLVHPKRHPMDIHIKLGADKSGRFKALKAEIIADTGAYASLGGPVLQRACTHASGPYNYKHLDVLGRALYTNNVPSGAYRGFGVTQSCFAIECAIDEMAEKLGMDKFEIRMKNAVRPGQILPNGQMASIDTAVVECLLAVKDAYYSSNRTGIALAMKNTGLGVGVPDTGRCTMSIENGKIHVRTSAACMGQGLATVALQITAETLNIEPELIVVESPDTTRTPDSGTSTASRQTAFTGEAVRRCAEKLKNEMNIFTLSDLEGAEYYAEFCYETDPITSTKGNPISHLAFSYSAQVAELDEERRVKKITAACDAGTVINVQSIEGQIEGGVLMGMGYALTENFNSDRGRVKSKYGTLGLLRSTDAPSIVTKCVQGPGRLPTAFGAKGVGELCTIATAPAIANAYSRVDNNRRRSLPIEDTPYRRK